MDARPRKTKRLHLWVVTLIILLGGVGGVPAYAEAFFFSTGNPDGLIATLSRVASAGKLETETADD
jgi:hypothetical protein